jgi:PAS domain S-box-containing protein
LISTLDNTIEIRQEFRSLFEYSLDFLFIYDFEGRILDVNDIVLKELEYSKEELLKMSIFDFVTDDEMNLAVTALSKIKENGRVTRYSPFRIKKKDEGYIYLEVSSIPFKLKNNKSVVLGIGHDITLLKETEKDLKLSEKKYRSLFDESPIGIMLFDLNGNLIDRNLEIVKGFPEYLGITLTGKNFKQILAFFINSEHLMKVFMERLRALRKGESLEPFEFFIDTKDRRRVWISWQSSLVKVNDETLIQVLLQNITERKEAEQKLQVLFNNSTSGIAYHRILYEMNGNPIDYIITDVNPQYENILLFKRENVINKKATEVYQVESAPYLDIYSKVATTQKSTSFETYFPPIDKHFKISVISSKKGEFITVFDDISEQKRTEQKLKEKNIELSVLNRIITLGNESTNLEEFLVKSYDQVLEIAGFDRGGVYLYNPETHHNFLVYHKNVHNDFIAAVEDVDISVGLFSTIFDKNNPFYIEDFSEFMENSKELGVYSAAIIPLRSKDKYVGSLNIGSQIHQILSENELDLLVAIGKQMGIIIQKFESENLLKESEEKFSKAFHSSPNMMAITHLEDGLILDVNDGFTQVLGYNREELIGNTTLGKDIWVNPKEREEFTKKMEEHGRVYSQDIDVRTKSGDILTVLISGELISLNEDPYLITIASDITEHRKAERSLKESEEKFRTIAEQSFMGITIVQDDVISYANQAILDIFGYSLEEIKSWEPLEYLKLFPPKDRAFILGQERKQQDGYDRSIHNYKVQFFKKNGESGWLDLFSTPIEYKGKLGGMVSVIDVTDKMKAEQNLKESEEKFRIITEQSFLGIVIMQDNQIKYANEAMTKITEYSTEELVGMSMDYLGKTIFHPEDLPFSRDRVRLRRQSGEASVPPYSAYRIFTKSGELRWIEDYTKDILYQGKNALLTSIMDITEKREAEKLIEKSEKKYRHLFENAPYAIGLIDGKGNIIDFNETVSDFFPNYKKHDLLGRDIFEWISTSNKEKIPLFRELLDQINKGEIKDSIEMQINRVIGDKIWINIHFSLLNIEDETLIQLIIQNITDKKEAEKLIIEENKKLLELDEIRKEMITRISHELKTPLTSIYGAIQILSESLRDQMNDNVLKFVDVIHRGSIRFKKLIENLLDISRMDSRKLELNAQQEDLSEIVNDCVNEMIYLANNRDLQINLNLPHDLLYELDKLRIEQAITNLISNAIKNTPFNGIISISLLDYKEYIDIKIEDTGVGLTPEEKLKLFKKFGKIERYGMDLDVDIEGIGLGLFISKEIVELHKGRILVESEGRNKGTTFTIRLFKN